MLPYIYIGSLELSTYWRMFVVGIGAMLALMLRRKANTGFGTVKSVLFTLGLAFCGLLSVKILYILENWRDTLENGLTLGGTSFFGAVFLVPVLMYAVGRLLKLRFGQTADSCALCVLAMIGCMRLGCFLSGCCGGNEATICGITFCWPTQAVESIGDFAILAWLYGCEERGKFQNRLYPMFMMSYSGMRFVIEFFRNTPKGWIFMSHGQWFAILALMLGWIWIFILNKKVGSE